MLMYPCSSQFSIPESRGTAGPSLQALSAAELRLLEKHQQGNPEWRFCLWGDGETPF